MSIILILFSIPVNAVKTDSFSLENNTGLDFMNGYYKVELIEISKPGDLPFVKVNLITGGLTKQYYLRENEDPDIKVEPFSKINLNSSFIVQTGARITVEYPDGWSRPEKYTIDKLIISEKIPNIVLNKSADRTTMKIGDVVEFKMILENTGNGTANNLTLEDRLPPGFSSAPGSRFPPAVKDQLEAGERLELLFALKAVEPGSYNIEPTIVKYGSNVARSNSLSITVLEEKKESSSIVTVITQDKENIFIDETVKVTVKITNNGNVSAESILIDGTLPKGLEKTEGDMRQVYKKIDPGESEEYSASIKGVESGNYSINLKTTYTGNSTGYLSNSINVSVTEKEKNYLYILIPAIIIIVGIALFIIRRHKEYSF